MIWLSKILGMTYNLERREYTLTPLLLVRGAMAAAVIQVHEQGLVQLPQMVIRPWRLLAAPACVRNRKIHIYLYKYIYMLLVMTTFMQQMRLHRIWGLMKLWKPLHHTSSWNHAAISLAYVCDCMALLVIIPGPTSAGWEQENNMESSLASSTYLATQKKYG